LLYKGEILQIIGIGTDLVSIARISSIWDRYGLAFAKRILANSELEELSKVKNPVGFLAKRYAAKEAVAKALGTGFQPHGFWLTDIAVSNDALGRPYLTYSRGAQAEVERRQIRESHLSLSDEREFALAFVILVG
jgi:holo-[acyl-carrier protein] synthase